MSQTYGIDVEYDEEQHMNQIEVEYDEEQHNLYN